MDYRMDSTQSTRLFAHATEETIRIYTEASVKIAGFGGIGKNRYVEIRCGREVVRLQEGSTLTVQPSFSIDLPVSGTGGGR